MRVAERKFANVEVGDRVSLWKCGVRVYGEVTQKVTGNGDQSFLRVAWDDGSRAKYTLKSLYKWSSFRVETDGLELAIRRMETQNEKDR